MVLITFCPHYLCILSITDFRIGGLNLKDWELIAEYGYTFEFEYRNGVEATVIARSEKEAWKKLKAAMTQRKH